MFLYVYVDRMQSWIMISSLQDVKKHLIQHSQQVEFIDCKKRHMVPSSNPCKGLGWLHGIYKVVSWIKLIDF